MWGPFRAIANFFKKFKKKEESYYPEPEEEIEAEEQRDNLPADPLPGLPRVYSTEEHAEELWYPKRVRNETVDKIQLKTAGYYSKGFPRGALIHTTDGRSRNKEMGGTRAQGTNYDQGLAALKYADRQNKYCYVVIDRDGNVFQNFPLNRWGYHSGPSKWPGISGRVDNDLVGIELACAGKMKYKDDENTYRAYFTNESKGDKPFYVDKGEINIYTKKTGNINKGAYHAISEKQKAALVDFLMWCEHNSPDFLFKNCPGHDEVDTRGWKSDPGGSLGQTTADFRSMLVAMKKAEKKS